MEKPDNQSIKDFLLEKTSEELQQPLSLVERVVGWSYKDMNKASKIYSEMEVSGLGKFLISQNKLKKRIKTTEEIQANLYNMGVLKDENKEALRLYKIQNNKEALEFYYSRLKTNSDENRVQENTGGVEKPLDTPSPSEGGN